MGILVLSHEAKQAVLDRLGSLPRPTYLAGKVVICIEINCRPDGSVGPINFETSVKEALLPAK